MIAPSAYEHIDVAWGVAENDLAALRRSQYRVLVVPNSGLEHLELNQATPALRDQRVRQALLYGIDNTSWLHDESPALSAAELAAIAQTSPVPNLSPWSDGRTLPENLYDPAKARRLLAAAGYATSPGGPGRRLHFDFYTTGYPSRVRSARELQREWARIGIALTLHFAPQRAPGGLLAPYDNGGILARRRFDIAEFAWGTATDPDSNHFSLDPGQIPDRTHPDGPNYAGVRDLALFDVLTRAGHTIDEAQRHRLYDQFQTMMVQRAYWIPLDSTSYDLIVKPTLGNFAPSPFGWWNWNTFEWYQGATG
jgi:ABC-type transport system substrate-binding protein